MKHAACFLAFAFGADRHLSARLVALCALALVACGASTGARPPRDHVALRREADALLQAERHREAIRTYLAYVDALERLPSALGVDATAKAELREQTFGRIAYAVVMLQVETGCPLHDLPPKRRGAAVVRIVASLEDASVVAQDHRALPEVYLAVSDELEFHQAFAPALALLARMTARFPGDRYEQAVADRSARLRELVRITTREEVR